MTKVYRPVIDAGVYLAQDTYFHSHAHHLTAGN
jgi:hypothetical protein